MDTPLFNGEPIHIWWDRVGVHKYLMGAGRSSQAYAVIDDNNVYIVRVTDVTNLMQKRIIQHEIEIYNHILKYPSYTKYISELLFSYCPPARSPYHEAFFIFRFKMGMPLESFLSFFQRQNLRIRRETFLRWKHELNETMDFLKSIGVVHRDIKPSNLFMDSESNRLLLFDFDTACFVGEDCRTSDFRGTQAYASENAKRLLRRNVFPIPHQYTHANDQHALDVMFAKNIEPITE